MAIRQKVLLVDSDKEFCDFLSDLLSECGYEVLHAATGEEAIYMASSHCPELMLMERLLPDIEGIREYTKQQLSTIWDEVKRFENPHEYYVDLSKQLWDLKQQLLNENYV